MLDAFCGRLIVGPSSVFVRPWGLRRQVQMKPGCSGVDLVDEQGYLAPAARLSSSGSGLIKD